MDVATIAQAVSASLTPFLPQLLKLGEKGVEGVAEKIGGDAWEYAKKLWSKVSPSIEKKPAAAEAISDLALAPQDVDAQAAVRIQLRKLFEIEPGLVKELTQLLEEQPRLTQTAYGNGNIIIGGSVVGATIKSGDSS